MPEKWHFYILRCSDGTLYCGITKNLAERLKKHNSGAGAKYTAGRRPVILVYNEQCDNISQARKREADVKRWSKIKKERLISESVPVRLP